MTFQISALDADILADLHDLSDQQLKTQNIQKMTVDAYPGFPCRISLEDAQIGETVYLLNFTHHDQETPYKASHAIFVREGAITARPEPGEIPQSLGSRLLSVRAFNESHNMVDADVVEGSDLAFSIGALFADRKVNYLHIHNARPGCYAARVDRV